MSRSHHEMHQTQRIGWLRAAVLGANDGIISTASLMLGLIASGTTNTNQTLFAGLAALIAGAMSMAAGEYVSVQSQADTENADLAKERAELAADPEHEHAELAAIYRGRGLDANTADVVAQQLMKHDALAAHARDELGITEILRARPMQAALSSAAAFTVGAALPILTTLSLPFLPLQPNSNNASYVLIASTLLALGLLGILAAKTGGTMTKSMLIIAAGRVVLWGAIALLISAIMGQYLGTILS